MKKTNNNGSVTIREVYELIDKRMEKVDNSINKLTDAFDTLESGRLSSVEKQVANMEGRAMMVPFLVSSGISVFFFFMNYIFNRV